MNLRTLSQDFSFTFFYFIHPFHISSHSSSLNTTDCVTASQTIYISFHMPTAANISLYVLTQPPYHRILIAQSLSLSPSLM